MVVGAVLCTSLRLYASTNVRITNVHSFFGQVNSFMRSGDSRNPRSCDYDQREGGPGGAALVGPSGRKPMRHVNKRSTV